MIQIPLTKGYVAIVDDEDADLAEYKWYPLTTKAGHVYAYRNRKKSEGNGTELLHRVIGARIAKRVLTRKDSVDHVDRVGLNNQRVNLRVCSQSQNLANQKTKSSSKTGVKGISPTHNTKNPWKAGIRFNGKTIYLGVFPTKEAAHEAYVEAAKKYFGEFARAA